MKFFLIEKNFTKKNKIFTKNLQKKILKTEKNLQKNQIFTF